MGKKNIFREVWRHAFTNVRHKYRFAVTDENFHEKLSFRLSRLNVWTVIALGSILIVALTVCIVVFTPLRQFIPGNIKQELVEQSIRDRMRVDSLQMQLEAQMLMMRTVNAALNGSIPMDESRIIRDSLRNYDNIEYRIGMADSLLRIEINKADKYTLDVSTTQIRAGDPKSSSFSDDLMFYLPAEGVVRQKFDHQNRHFGIDIETRANSVIKAVLDGTVVFTSWSPDQGYVLVLEHDGKLLSIYASASTLFKRTGEFVRAGEALGISGLSSEHAATDNLHFELWYSGTPIDPEKYLTL
ncbi:MAG: M23 family metallopeptidase [Bacteroidales bacterium]|nr:M23 family metallopeptidase [Bacteroidales bacterium]